MNASQIPNIISIIRIILVAPIVWCLLNHYYHWALVLFLVAGISDGVDGYLARRFKWTSRLGHFLDPIGDKLLMFFSYITLGWLGWIPLWLIIAVILRDIIIVAGTVIYRWKVEAVTPEPIFISKLNTALQIILVVFVIMSGANWLEAGLLIEVLMYLVLITTIISGAGYVGIWIRRARLHFETRNIS